MKNLKRINILRITFLVSALVLLIIMAYRIWPAKDWDTTNLILLVIMFVTCLLGANFHILYGIKKRREVFSSLGNENTTLIDESTAKLKEILTKVFKQFARDHRADIETIPLIIYHVIEQNKPVIEKWAKTNKRLVLNAKESHFTRKFTRFELIDIVVLPKSVEVTYMAFVQGKSKVKHTEIFDI
jgi:hypothetical protein